MNGKMVNGKAVYVNRAQKKKERQMELHRRYEAEKMERYNRSVCAVLDNSCHPSSILIVPFFFVTGFKE